MLAKKEPRPLGTLALSPGFLREIPCEEHRGLQSAAGLSKKPCHTSMTQPRFPEGMGFAPVCGGQALNPLQPPSESQGFSLLA